MLSQLPLWTLILWGAATTLTLALFVQLLVIGQFRRLPLFALYLAVNLLQTVVGLFVYHGYGFWSDVVYPIVWTSQAIVVIARALAVTEVCFLVLSSYRGIWGLAARILCACGLGALTLALYFGRHGYQIGVVTLEIALEASFATSLVALFVFARYYHVRIAQAMVLLGMGLGLLSCTKVLNDVVFERFLKVTGTTWNQVSSIAFIGILLVWIWGLRKPVAVPAIKPHLASAEPYAELMPAVNQRLHDLNEQLIQLWRLERPKT